MNYKNMFNALAMLNTDYRVPLKTLRAKTNVTDEELLHIVESTGAKHYRILGMLPPSELLNYKDYPVLDGVKEFYELLEDAGLGKYVIDEHTLVKGFVPNKRCKRYCLHVPAWGRNWYAWDPEVLKVAYGS